MRDWLLGQPLLLGWIGPAGIALAVGAVVALWAWRTRLLRPVGQAVVFTAGVVTAVAAWALVDGVWRPVAEGLGWVVWSWVGLIALAAAQLVAGPWRRRGPRRRPLAFALGGTAAVGCVVLGCLLTLNAHYSTYPNLAALTGANVTIVPWDEAHLETDGRTGERGQLVEAHIPSSDPDFSPRPGLVYVPPAYRAEDRPELPVMVLLAGQPGGPTDWPTVGRAVETLDAFAAKHGGRAPIVVFPDHLGGALVNPLCSDAQHGKVATYLQEDVPRWLEQHLDVAEDRPWAVGGISNGGTCALQVVTRDPERYSVLMDMSGETHPTLGDEQRTLDQGYGGDVAAMADNDPLTLMQRERYPEVKAIFSAGERDEEFGPDTQTVADAARAAGMDVQVRHYPGGHAWSVWSVAFADQLPWAAREMGIR